MERSLLFRFCIFIGKACLFPPLLANSVSKNHAQVKKGARYAEGSCVVKFGATHVLCTASLEDKPPQVPSTLHAMSPPRASAIRKTVAFVYASFFSNA